MAYHTRKIIRVLTLFAISIVVICLSFILVTSIKAKSLRFDNKISEIYLGDSHVRYAINDSLLINSLNLGNSSESTYFSYFKLKHILKSNPNIKTINIGFSYHNISEYYDQYISGQYSQHISPNYFYILPLKEQFQTIKWNLRRLPFFMVSILNTGIKCWMNKNTFQGGFDNPYIKVSAQEAAMNERLTSQYIANEKLNSYSNINLTYFENIITLCNTEDVELIISNTPLHPYYQSKVPAQFVSRYDSIVSSKNIRVMDLSRLELADYCFQPDGDLVSKEGALETTKTIANIKQVSNYNLQQNNAPF